MPLESCHWTDPARVVQVTKRTTGCGQDLRHLLLFEQRQQDRQSLLMEGVLLFSGAKLAQYVCPEHPLCCISASAQLLRDLDGVGIGAIPEHAYRFPVLVVVTILYLQRL